MEIVIGVLLILVSIFLIVAVLFQSSKNARLSGAIAGSAETFFGKSKGKTIDKKLSKLTVIVSIIFAIVVLALYAIQPGKAKLTYDYDFLKEYIEGVKNGTIEITVSEEEEEHDHDHDHDHGDEDADKGTDEGVDNNQGDSTGSDNAGSDNTTGDAEGGEGNPDDSNPEA